MGEKRRSMADPALAHKGGLGLRPCTAAGASIVLSFLLGQFSLAQPLLPQDLEHIVSMNTQSLQRLQTAVGTLDSSVWWKVGNRGTLSYTVRCSFSIDGKKIREEKACIRDDSIPRRIVTSEPNEVAIRWVQAPSESLEMQVILPEACFGWAVESGRVGILPGNPDGPYGGDVRSQFFSQMPPGGKGRLGDIVSSLAKDGRLPTITDDLWDGVECKRLEWGFGPADPGTLRRIWVAPSKGYMVVADQMLIKGQPSQEYSAKLREYQDGVFWFEQAEEKHWDQNGLYERTSTQITSLRVNVSVDPAVFTMKGLGIPIGFMIDDDLLHKRYRYGDVIDLPDGYPKAIWGGSGQTSWVSDSTDAVRPGMTKGVVLDPNGRPAANVVVFACYWIMGRSGESQTSQDGTFAVDLKCQDKDVPCCAVVARDARRNLVATVGREDLMATGKIQLSTGVRVAGKVQGPDGRGIRGARLSPVLHISMTDGRAVGWPVEDAVEVQEDGSFVISAVIAGPEYCVQAEADGYGRGEAAVKTEEEKPRVDLPPIILAKADQSVEGTVFGQDARPIAGVRVSVSGPSKQPFSETTTDQNGGFSLYGLVRGEVQVWAYMSQTPRLAGSAEAQTGDRDVRIVVSEVDEQGRPVKPALPTPQSLLARPMPSLAELSSSLVQLQADPRPLLVCFVDLDQRPSRRCLSDLAERSATLAAKGIAVAAVRVSKADPGQLNEWLKTNKIDFPIHVMEGDIEVKKAQWGVKAVPWLILADKKHVVNAEGFDVASLDERIESLGGE
jgi:hypothetical protein